MSKEGKTTIYLAGDRKKVPGLPAGEIVWETIRTGDSMFYITSKENRDWYYMYRGPAAGAGKAEKLGRGASPAALTKRYCREGAEAWQKETGC